MSGHSTPSWGTWMWKKIKDAAKGIWGDFESFEELQKFFLLGLVFFFVIGVYWTLRPIKDTLFDVLVGGEAYQPVAKFVSMLVIFPLIIFYSKLIDMFPRSRVFYGLLAMYAALAMVFFAIFHFHPTHGLLTAVKSPYNMVGWAWYVYVESFGSLIVSLFWAIVSDITMPESARRGFPMIVFGGQLGNVIGPRYLQATRLGFKTSAPIVMFCGLFMLCAALVLFFFMKVTPKHLLKGYHGKNEAAKEKEQEPGFLEGLRILLSNWYVFGIFLIITFYEVINTFIDYNFKVTVLNTFDSEVIRSSYLGDYASMVGVVALICIALGIGNVQKWLGMRVALIALPVLMFGAIVGLKTYPGALPVLFWVMICSKALNYALNQPTLKQLYIPTTHDTKYKAQAWGDSFGSRGAKALSSGVNLTRAHIFIKKFGPLVGVHHFVMMTSLLSFGMIGVWLLIAVYIAKTYNKAIKENRVVC